MLGDDLSLQAVEIADETLYTLLALLQSERTKLALDLLGCCGLAGV